MDNDIAIGIDLGGTKIMTGAINGKGEILGTPVKTATVSSDTADRIVRRIIDSVESVLKDIRMDITDVKGIGIGSTGPLDLEEGLILECPQLPNMHFFPIRKVIEDYFRVPVCLNNDANCLIYGECIFGAGSGKKNVLGFTLGTGFGCAIVLNQKIMNGSSGTAGEIWPSPYGSGVIEDYISGNGVMAMYKAISGKEASSLEIFQLAENGDKDALATWKEFGFHLASAISWSVNILDPEIVILGGSISKAHTYFKESMEEKLRKHLCPVPAEKTKVEIAKLGDNAGFIGAACMLIMDDK